MDVVEAIQSVASDLVVQEGFAPLERMLPEASFPSARFDACLARLQKNQLQVLAVLAWRGQDSDDLLARSEGLRQGLQSAAAAWGVRAMICVMLVEEGSGHQDAMLAALQGVKEGHFLERSVACRAALSAATGEMKVLGRGAPVPSPEWFEERFLKGGRHSRQEAELALLAREDEERKTRRLLGNGRKLPKFTVGLIVACVVGFLLEKSSGSSLAAQVAQAMPQLSPGEAQDLAFMKAIDALGANSGEAVFGHGQYWRLLASMFLHHDEFHLLMNMMALFLLGNLVERISGGLRMLLIYFSSGLLASLASAAFNFNIASVGASGAIMGLSGALLALHFRRPEGFPKAIFDRIYDALAGPVAFLFVLGLLLPLFRSHIIFDNWAHLGGLAGGFGLVFLRPGIVKRANFPAENL